MPQLTKWRFRRARLEVRSREKTDDQMFKCSDRLDQLDRIKATSSEQPDQINQFKSASSNQPVQINQLNQFKSTECSDRLQVIIDGNVVPSSAMAHL